MIAALIAQGYLLFLFWAIKPSPRGLGFELALLVWMTETVATASYLAWKYLP